MFHFWGGMLVPDIVLNVLASSLASQLPQVSLVFTRIAFIEDPCGSWLASDAVSRANELLAGRLKSRVCRPHFPRKPLT
jgi:hypothetical protein